jgi:hypothetical protein
MRFHLAQPKDFRRLKASEGRIARYFREALDSNPLSDGLALCSSSLVVP